MRVAINLLTDDPAHPSGAHWSWTRIIPEMAKRLTEDEELHLLVSPTMRPLHEGYGPGVHYITFPWSNERRWPRTLSEHLYAPVRLPRSKIDVFNTLLAPIVKPAPGLVAHIKTLHAYTTPGAIGLPARVYRRLSYPRTVRTADAIVINSQSLKSELLTYLDVDESKLRMITEGVDHERFRPGDPDEAWDHLRSRYGVDGPFVLFVSSLWQYKNCHGLIEAFAQAKPKLGDVRLVVVGAGRDEEYVRRLHELADRLGVSDDLIWIGPVTQAETVWFYRCAEAFAYPSFNETFGLPILESMATGCPVITSNVTAMPETAGDAALLVDPHSPESIADALIQACGPQQQRLRDLGFAHAAKFTWESTAEQTLQVYREVYANRRSR